MEAYREVNRAWWDARANAHARSADYAVERFVEDSEFLSRIVRFDLPLLGDICGLRGVHLQCHIGTDTVSLARLGARMTGVDFSAASLEQARGLASRAGTEVEFVESAVDDAVEVLGKGGFDLVYTGVGALCWLPSVTRWAAVVAGLLAPGGRLFIREGHPMLWTLDEDRSDEMLVVRYPYFEQAESSVDERPGTYVETDATFEHDVAHYWNHGLGEIITALLDQGMQVTALAEHDTVPWEALPGQMHQVASNEWQLRDRPERVAHSYTLQAVKRRGLAQPRLDHVQMTGPRGCEEQARAFYGQQLGLQELDKPEGLRRRGGVWFAIGDQELHVGVEEPFAPALKAHPAFRWRNEDELRRIAAQLSAAGIPVHWDEELPGVLRFFSSDPWGNRLEFLAEVG